MLWPTRVCRCCCCLGLVAVRIAFRVETQVKPYVRLSGNFFFFFFVIMLFKIFINSFVENSLMF